MSPTWSNWRNFFHVKFSFFVVENAGFIIEMNCILLMVGAWDELLLDLGSHRRLRAFYLNDFYENKNKQKIDLKRIITLVIPPE